MKPIHAQQDVLRLRLRRERRRRRARTALVAGTVVAVAMAGSWTATAVATPPAKTAAADRTGPAERGHVVSAEHLRTLSARAVRAELAGDEAGAWDTDAVRFGVDTYRLVYRTVDPHGRPTIASGLLALPRNGERHLRTVSFTHGTELFKGDAPSVSQDVWDQAPALTYASAGFTAVAPDYLGLGLGPGPHPWMDVPSETTASLDMLRAARDFVPTAGRQLRDEVLVTGFSQGASAALGLARTLQEGADPRFRLGAVAPVSGAYAFRDVELPALLNGETDPKAGVIYAALTLVAFNRLHHLYDSPSEMFRAPYDRRIERLLDGTHTGQEVVAGTPGTLDKLLTPRARTLLAHPTGPLAAALRVADGVCTDWTPRVPIRLYAAENDEQAVNANSEYCRAALDAPLINLGTPDYGGSRHLGSQQAATADVVRWFSELTATGAVPRP
ncbi:alpha/beta hydrolase family protein [Streptomyces sp. 4N124]|uniref:alpha/beta hydrolase family protein n=1 Tax=Streptomyces sp. 4N124 TaxID=3457420 RepID=UPI003FD17EF5